MKDKADDFKIEAIDEIECDNTEQLRKKEREYISINNSIKNGLNTNIPGRTKRERYEANREDIKAYYRKHRQRYLDRAATQYAIKKLNRIEI